MATTVWSKTRKIIGALVIACFFLPFFGVSCNGMEIVTISGADMVGGCKPGGAIAEMEKQGGGGRGPRASGLEAKVQKVEIEPLAIAGLALALITFGLAWLATHQALVLALVTAAAGAGVLVGLWIKMSGTLDEQVEASKKQQGGGAMAREMQRDMNVDAGGRMGLYGCILGFGAVAVLSGLALRPRAALGGPPPSAPPPGFAPPPA